MGKYNNFQGSKVTKHPILCKIKLSLHAGFSFVLVSSCLCRLSLHLMFKLCLNYIMSHSLVETNCSWTAQWKTLPQCSLCVCVCVGGACLNRDVSLQTGRSGSLIKWECTGSWIPVKPALCRSKSVRNVRCVMTRSPAYVFHFWGTVLKFHSLWSWLTFKGTCLALLKLT